jgi:hypothetical protein
MLLIDGLSCPPSSPVLFEELWLCSVSRFRCRHRGSRVDLLPHVNRSHKVDDREEMYDSSALVASICASLHSSLLASQRANSRMIAFATHCRIPVAREKSDLCDIPDSGISNHDVYLGRYLSLFGNHILSPLDLTRNLSTSKA